MKFLSEARQPEVDFLHLWAVVLPNVWVSLLYNRKDTKQYNLVAFRHARYISSVRVQPLYSQLLRQKSGRLKIDFH